MTDWLRELGHRINHKRVERLMQVMGLQATLPGPHTSRGHLEHRIYPVPQNAPHVSTGMNVLDFPEGHRPKATDVSPWYGVYPYLLRDLTVERPNQVWCADITYVAMRRGFLYLVAVLDWFSRYMLAWELSNTLEATFCVEALERALAQGHPDIFNTDQGAQFTGEQFTGCLERVWVQISMDGRGRALDNVMVE